MVLSVDVWLRGTDFATTETVEEVIRAPADWTDVDVRLMLESMLRALDRRMRPGEPDRPIALRGLSWIVNPYEDGGVVIAIEIGTGAAVAGPFDVEQGQLEEMITRVLARPEKAPSSSTVN